MTILLGVTILFGRLPSVIVARVLSFLIDIHYTTFIATADFQSDHVPRLYMMKKYEHLLFDFPPQNGFTSRAEPHRSIVN
jgi:hypothetical protein